MRFELQQIGDTDAYRVLDTVSGIITTSVWDDGSDVGSGMDKALASVLTFAANAVADGLTLTAERYEVPGGMPERIEYEGPTDL